LLAPVLRALEQAREDLTSHCDALTDEEVWAAPLGLTPLGFHLRHIAGSLDRLTTYLQGGTLTAAQFIFLETENSAGGTRQYLVELVGNAIERAAEMVRQLDPQTLSEPRAVGRNTLPTTVIGLAVHLAEHTQRHVGQAITTCNVLKAVRSSS
jgi:hypothetical protein